MSLFVQIILRRQVNLACLFMYYRAGSQTAFHMRVMATWHYSIGLLYFETNTDELVLQNSVRYCGLYSG